jgi:CheY-specific phosphatase CheX
MVFSSDFFGADPDSKEVNELLQYLQHQSPDVLARVAKSASPEIKEIISQNVQGLLGMLPSESFSVQVVTNRENLAGLLASAMMTGYFLRQMEQRMELEERVTDSLSSFFSMNADDHDE